MARTYGTQIQSNSVAKNSGSDASVTSTPSTIVPANPARALLILNNKDATLNVWLSFGGTAAVNSGLRLAPGATFTITAFTGAVSAIASGAGPAVVGIAEI